MDQPFQNWTRADATLIGVVMLFELRGQHSRPAPEAERIVRASPLWDGDVFLPCRLPISVRP